LAAAHAGAQQEWQRLTQTMRAKRGGGPAAEAPPAEAAKPTPESSRKRGRKG
jgi:hypothetical protein